MISPIRLQIDLFIQVLLLAAGACLLFFLPHWAWLLLCIIATWQLVSATELWLSFRLHTRHPFLLAGVFCFLFGLLTDPILGNIRWLPLLIVVLVHLWRTIYEYRVVRRRGRTFWDL